MGCGGSAATAPPETLQAPAPEKAVMVGTSNAASNVPGATSPKEQRNSIFSSVRSSAKSEDVPPPQTNLEPLFVMPDLYGLLVTEPLQLDSTIDGWGIIIPVMFRLLFLALTTFAMQLLTASHMHGISKAKDGGQCPLERLSFQMISVFIILASFLRKMRDIANLAYLLIAAPVKPDASYTAVASTPIQERRLGFTDRMSHFQKRRHSASDASSLHWSFEPLTTRWKVFSLLCIVLPRAVLAMFVAKAGAYLVVRTDPESAVVDTIATLFISDLDNFVYTAFTAATTKQQLASTVPVQAEVSDRHRVMSFVFANAIGPLMTVAVTATLVFTMRRSCSGDSAAGSPEMPGDVHSEGALNSPLSDLMGIFTFW